MESIESVIANAERPKTFRKRCVNANVTYSYLFDRFQTHNFLDWHYKYQLYDIATWDYEKHPVNVKEEVNLIKAVPPYCERFDEFLGYWLSCGTPINVPFTLEGFFPNPDEIDCSYLEDVLDELERIGGNPNDVYITVKGSSIGIGPGICECYARNIARAQRWVSEVKVRLQKHIDTPTAKPKALIQQISTIPNTVPLASLLKNGFSISELNQLLSKLGMVKDARHCIDSKAGIWVAVIEALRVKKLLDTSNSKSLHAALVKEYGEGNNKNLPSLRTIQRGFNNANTTYKHFYNHTLSLLRPE
jgi:hypothetical protein